VSVMRCDLPYGPVDEVHGPFSAGGYRRMLLSPGPDPGERHLIIDVPAVVHDRTTRGGKCHAEATAINDRHQSGARGSRW
jgi:hypothetical protein